MTMVDNIFPTQGFLKNIFQGLWKEKIHIKIILIILIQEFHHTLIQACQRRKNINVFWGGEQKIIDLTSLYFIGFFLFTNKKILCNV